MELLGQGRTCDVWDLGDGTVLRVRRDGGSVEHEALVMRHVHDHGFPCPRVHRVAGAEMVLDRVDGPTMAEDLVATPTVETARSAGVVLAELHDLLHRMPPLTPDSGQVLHLDLHPENVVMTAAGPVLIDWTNADEGPGELDVAMSWVILEPYARESPLVREMLDAFLQAVGPDVPLRALAGAAARRSADPNVTEAEVAVVHSLMEGEQVIHGGN